jgi:hypothetical protein
MLLSGNNTVRRISVYNRGRSYINFSLDDVSLERCFTPHGQWLGSARNWLVTSRIMLAVNRERSTTPSSWP